MSRKKIAANNKNSEEMKARSMKNVNRERERQGPISLDSLSFSLLQLWLVASGAERAVSSLSTRVAQGYTSRPKLDTMKKIRPRIFEFARINLCRLTERTL
jgi:hypothetical protein